MILDIQKIIDKRFVYNADGDLNYRNDDTNQKINKDNITYVIEEIIEELYKYNPTVCTYCDFGWFDGSGLGYGCGETCKTCKGSGFLSEDEKIKQDEREYNTTITVGFEDIPF